MIRRLFDNLTSFLLAIGIVYFLASGLLVAGIYLFGVGSVCP